MRTTFRALAVAAGILTMAGCSGSRSAQVPVIEESWLARVPQEQLEPVYEARSQVRRAEDEVTRAGVQVTDATSQVRVARAQLDAAERELDVAKANLAAAKEQAQRPGIIRAEQQLDVAKLAVQTAKERVKLTEERLAAAEAKRQLEVAQVDSARVNLARTEYEILSQTGDTRVEAYDAADFDKAAAATSAEEADAQKEHQKRLQAAQQAEERYQHSRSQLQAARNAAPDVG